MLLHIEKLEFFSNILSMIVDHLEKKNECIIDLNLLVELVEICVMLVGQYHRRGLYCRRQRVLNALFKDRHKVK